MTAFPPRRIGYWASTGIVAFVMVASGAVDVIQPPELTEIAAALGYPLYFFAWLGVWKVLGGAMLVAPKFPLVKEWAYAGITIDLSSAAVSHVVAEGSYADAAIPAALLVVTAVSWALRPADRRLV